MFGCHKDYYKFNTNLLKNFTKILNRILIKTQGTGVFCNGLCDSVKERPGRKRSRRPNLNRRDRSQRHLPIPPSATEAHTPLAVDANQERDPGLSKRERGRWYDSCILVSPPVHRCRHQSLPVRPGIQAIHPQPDRRLLYWPVGQSSQAISVHARPNAYVPSAFVAW